MPPNENPLAILEDRHARPLRDLRISVTDKCNFRCPYCMPAEIFGEKYPFLERDEILQEGIGRDLLRAHAALRRADAAATADWSIESEVRRFSEVW